MRYTWTVSKEKKAMFTNKMILYLMILFSVISTHKAFSQPSEGERLNLKQCVEIALKNNPQIIASQISVSELKNKIPEARAGLYPSFNLNANSNLLFPSSASNAEKIRNNFTTGLSMSYNIFQGGKNIASINAARYNYQSAEAGFKGSRQDLILSVTEIYYQLLQAEQFTNVAEKSLQSAKSHLNFANARFMNGLASRSDILKAKTELSNAKLDLIHVRNIVLMDRGKLNNILGRNVNDSLKIVDNLNSAVANTTSEYYSNFKTLMENADRDRPELREIEWQLQAQKSFIRLTKGDYYPSVSLGGNYNLSDNKISQSYPSNFVGLSLNFPLFKGFYRSARVSQEKLEMQVIEQKLESVRQQIGLEVWNAFLALKEVKERIINTGIFLKDAKDNLDISEGEYKEGIGSMLDVLDAETTFVSAEQRSIEAFADYKIAEIVLQRAVSGTYFKEILK